VGNAPPAEQEEFAMPQDAPDRRTTEAVSDHLAAVAFFARQGTADDIALSAAIPRRRTDRRRFSSWTVPPRTTGAPGCGRKRP
jgi:hypothetical protein